MQKKRVLLCVYHFIAPDIATFFESHGYDVELLGYYENGDYTRVWRNDPQQVLEQIATKPDLFFTLNTQHLDPSGRTARLLRSLKIPHINWYLDTPFSAISPWHISNGALQPSEYTHLWCIDQQHTKTLSNLGYNATYVPHITTDRFCNATPSTIKHEVSFIGNLGLELQNTFDTFVGNHENILRWSSSFIDAFVAADTRDFEHFLSSYTPAPQPFLFNRKTDVGSQQCDFLKFLSSAYTRKALVQSLPKNNIRIYGDEDWLHCIDERCYGARINYQVQTPLIYASTAININITHLQFENAFNQRILDVLAGGNFLLTDYTPALEEYFTIGTDIICYKNRAEIPALIAHYLAHPQERIEIAQRGREIIRSHFSLDQRFLKLCNDYL